VVETPLMIGKRLVERWGLAPFATKDCHQNLPITWAHVWNGAAASSINKVISIGRFGEIRGECLTKREQCSIAILASRSMLLPYP
jgi:hypothetical protein